MIESLVSLLTERSGITGFVAGLLSLLVVSATHAATGWLKYVGVPLAATAAVSLLVLEMASLEVIGGIALIAVGGALSARFGLRLLIVFLGSLIVASQAPDLAWWARVVVAAGVVPVGMALARTDRLVSRSLGPSMLAMSVAGIALGVPDVEAPLAVLGSLLPISLVALATGWRLGGAGSFALGGLVLFMLTTAAVNRPGAVIGGVSTLGLLLTGRVLERWSWPAALLVHGGWVLYSARMVGLRTSPARALLLLSAGVLISFLLIKASENYAARTAQQMPTSRGDI